MMAILSSVRDFLGISLVQGNEDTADKAPGDEGPLIAHRRPDGTIIRYEASESLLKAAALAAGRVPPPDLR